MSNSFPLGLAGGDTFDRPCVYHHHLSVRGSNLQFTFREQLPECFVAVVAIIFVLSYPRLPKIGIDLAEMSSLHASPDTSDSLHSPSEIHIILKSAVCTVSFLLLLKPWQSNRLSNFRKAMRGTINCVKPNIRALGGMRPD
jgi:hypothetical protein